MLVVEVLDGKKHERNSFDCGITALNNYLQTKASQDVRDGYCQVYVVSDEEMPPKQIYGFFSLSPYTLEFAKITALLPKNKMKYSTVPSILLGRLAKNKNQNLISGSELLLLAIREAKSVYEKLGGVFIVVHPKNNIVKEFYLRHGFTELVSDDETLVANIKNINVHYSFNEDKLITELDTVH